MSVEKIEYENVKKVYDAIADHFDVTRFSVWIDVKKFMSWGAVKIIIKFMAVIITLLLTIFLLFVIQQNLSVNISEGYDNTSYLERNREF